jgi:hypothetical protein
LASENVGQAFEVGARLAVPDPAKFPQYYRARSVARRRRLWPSGGLLLLAPQEGAGPADDLGQDEGPERIQRGVRRGIL